MKIQVKDQSSYYPSYVNIKVDGECNHSDYDIQLLDKWGEAITRFYPLDSVWATEEKVCECGAVFNDLDGRWL